ncbi:hypothetical protein QR680_016707 [Steinernema hermaphroditum]|uniref:Uncharacterized protein n=1 Tax=Steinernema hermaphroditum TaxID=289476 RepID=A0AA39HCG6_9BILA|nr:hypothetical protein QR680_016707 [Steinernema hermaphroditum]
MSSFKVTAFFDNLKNKELHLMAAEMFPVFTSKSEASALADFLKTSSNSEVKLNLQDDELLRNIARFVGNIHRQVEQGHMDMSVAEDLFDSYEMSMSGVIERHRAEKKSEEAVEVYPPLKLEHLDFRWLSQCVFVEGQEHAVDDLIESATKLAIEKPSNPSKFKDGRVCKKAKPPQSKLFSSIGSFESE